MADGLKPGWQRVTFGEVVRLNKESSRDPAADGLERYVGLEHIEPGDLRIRSWGDIADGTTFTKRFRPGHVLFGKRRAYQRKVAVADFDGVCSGDIYVFEPKNPGVLLPELLPFICQTDAFFDHAIGTSAGSLSPRTNWKSLAQYVFVLPPLEEQRRIARTLRQSAFLTESLQDAIFESQRMRAAAIDHLMSTQDGAVATKLDDVASMQNGRPFPGSDYLANGMRLLRPGNLGVSGYLVWPQSKTVCLQEEWKDQASDFVISSGDLVINLTAQSLEDGFMGRVCLAREGDESLLNQRIGRLCTDESRLSREYLFRALQTSRFRRHAESHCEGTKVKHMFWSHIARYSIFIPPLAAQQETVRKCAQLDASVVSLTDRRGSASAQHFRLINDFAGVRSG